MKKSLVVFSLVLTLAGIVTAQARQAEVHGGDATLISAQADVLDFRNTGLEVYYVLARWEKIWSKTHSGKYALDPETFRTQVRDLEIEHKDYASDKQKRVHLSLKDAIDGLHELNSHLIVRSRTGSDFSSKDIPARNFFPGMREIWLNHEAYSRLESIDPAAKRVLVFRQIAAYAFKSEALAQNETEFLLFLRTVAAGAHATDEGSGDRDLDWSLRSVAGLDTGTRWVVEESLTLPKQSGELSFVSGGPAQTVGSLFCALDLSEDSALWLHAKQNPLFNRILPAGTEFVLTESPSGSQVGHAVKIQIKTEVHAFLVNEESGQTELLKAPATWNCALGGVNEVYEFQVRHLWTVFGDQIRIQPPNSRE